MVTRARAETRAKANIKRSQTGARLSTQASTGSFEAVTATAKKRKAEESTAEQVSDKIDESKVSGAEEVATEGNGLLSQDCNNGECI